jgi:hypothetical protein
MTQVQFTDTVALREVQTHKDGYKIVRGRIARTGLQGYLRRELGDAAPMGDPNDVLQIYRPDDEVFADEALNGWAHVPVTVDHPPELVTPDNVSKYAVGETTARARVNEDGWLDLEWIVKAARGISAMDSTHLETSGGYQALIDFTPGVTPDGRKYDGVQRGINPNHLALVPNGRAFSDAAPVAKWGATPVILDKKEVQMDIKTVVVGDKAVQVAASDAHTIEQVMKDHKAELAAKDAEIAAAQETIGELKAECADTAKKVMSDADIAAAVVARKAVTDKAAEFVEGFNDEGQTLADIKRAAVKAKFGDEAAATEVSDAEINGIFRVMEPAKVNDAARDAMKEGKEKAKPKGNWDGMYKKKGDK